jgi:hypothetical protein
MQTLFLMYLVFGALLVGLSIPLLLDKIPPNGWYGFRVPSTLYNPDVWYKVNRYAARWLLLSGVVTIVAAIALYYLVELTVDQFAWLMLGIFAAAFVPGLLLSFRYLRRLT